MPLEGSDRNEIEAPGVEPAFAAPDAKRKAINYACGRFGGRVGEVHVYDESGEIVERKIAIDARGQYSRKVGGAVATEHR